MRKSLKIAAAAVVLCLALGAIVFVFASSQNGFRADDDELQAGIQDMQSFFASNNVTMPCHMRHMRQMPGNGFLWVEGLSENATLSTVQGSVVAQSRGILVLDTGSGQIRVLLPNGWSVGSEIVSRATLFNGTFASPGQSVTVKVLESDLFTNANLSINTMLGYEAINATGTHAYAVLPFNIQPPS